MYKIRPSVKFQKDLKRVQKRGYDISLLTNVLNLLVSGEPLPAKYKTIVYWGIIQGAESVILLLIGF